MNESTEHLVEILRRSNPIFVQLHRNLQLALSNHTPSPSTTPNPSR